MYSQTHITTYNYARRASSASALAGAGIKIGEDIKISFATFSFFDLVLLSHLFSILHPTVACVMSEPVTQDTIRI